MALTVTLRTSSVALSSDKVPQDISLEKTDPYILDVLLMPVVFKSGGFQVLEEAHWH